METYASSACEMVSEILQYTSDGIRIKSEEADSMYAGMVVDTQNFMTKTGVRTFEAAAFLRRNGADVTRVRKLFRENAAEYKAKADAVSQAEIYRNAYAISICHSEGIASPTVVGAQAANELLDIRGVKASFVLTEYQNKSVFLSTLHRRSQRTGHHGADGRRRTFEHRRLPAGKYVRGGRYYCTEADAG